MKKYIIKNCENLVYCPSCKTYECGLCLQGDDYRRKCEDNTNCRLKQIVEKCNKTIVSCKNCTEELRAKSYIDCTDCVEDGRSNLASEILQLLKIQEVEE